MNFYPMHIGDYVSATNHLSWDEDCAYRRLLDLYYKHEKPLPTDLAMIHRQVRARRDKEKSAIEAVLKEFFKLGDEGWAHKRCEEEIGKASERRERAAESANVRWGDKTVTRQQLSRKKGSTRTAKPTSTSSPEEVHHQAAEAEHASAANEEPGAFCSPVDHANALPTHCERIANAMPTQCEGNAPNPNPIPIPNPITNPNPISSGGAASPVSPASPASCPSAHDPPPAGHGQAHAVAAPHTQAAAAPHPDLPRPDTPTPELPTQVGEWINFFSRHGFAREGLQDPKLRALIGEWIAARVDQPLLREAMQGARERLGYAPASPLYYKQFVAELLLRKAAGMRTRDPSQAQRGPSQAQRSPLHTQRGPSRAQRRAASRYAELNPLAGAPYIAPFEPLPPLGTPQPPPGMSMSEWRAAQGPAQRVGGE